MVTVEAGFVIPLNTSDQGSTALGIRRAFATLFRQTSPGVAAPGRLGNDHFAVTGSPTSMVYNVTGGGIVLVRSTANGAYLVGMPTSVVVPTDPADAVNPRIDRIYVKQPDPALDGAGVDVQFIIDVVKGSPAATPLVPSLPSGCYEIARKRIGASAANTNAGDPFTDVAPVTGLNVGGTLTVPQGGTGGTTKPTARAGIGITSGTAAPSNGTGEDGDIYFQII